MSHIFHLKKLATGFQVDKALIKYNSKSLEEMMKKMSKLILNLLTKKFWFWNDEIAFDFRWSGVQEKDKEDIDLANFIENEKTS